LLEGPIGLPRIAESYRPVTEQIFRRGAAGLPQHTRFAQYPVDSYVTRILPEPRGTFPIGRFGFGQNILCRWAPGGLEQNPIKLHRNLRL
jgi:hypothetical protein